jgi:hypothetical protein
MWSTPVAYNRNFNSKLLHLYKHLASLFFTRFLPCSDFGLIFRQLIFFADTWYDFLNRWAHSKVSAIKRHRKRTRKNIHETKQDSNPCVGNACQHEQRICQFIGYNSKNRSDTPELTNFGALPTALANPKYYSYNWERLSPHFASHVGSYRSINVIIRLGSKANNGAVARETDSLCTVH